MLKRMVKTALRFFMLPPRSGYSHPLRRSFGTRPIAAVMQGADAATSLTDDIKLFAMFFLGGLTFMSVYLA
jgi:hypothetical protein